MVICYYLLTYYCIVLNVLNQNIIKSAEDAELAVVG